MGNTASNANPQRHSTLNPRIHHRHPSSSSSSSPAPGQPHSSLRTKKKSLELPDLASLSITNHRGRQTPNPPKSASIPIPIPIAPPNTTTPGEAGRTRPPATFSSTDLLVTDQPTTQHYPFPPPPRGNAYFRGTQSRQQSHTREQQQAAYIQELYNQSHVVPAPPPSPTSSGSQFVQETVRSSIPVALGKAVVSQLEDAGIPVPIAEESGPPELVPVKITWRGGGKVVFLARAGDNDWAGRQAMERESPTSSSFHTSVSLPPGTHHIRFLVDDQWRVADDLPTAVDDQGSLANYVAAPVTSSPPNPTTSISPPPPPPPIQRRNPGQSFWSAASSTDDESTDGQPQPQTPQQVHIHRHTHHHHQPVWTSVLPPELIEAAREEEAYLSASSGQPDPSHRGTTLVNGFVPAPNIPPAPGLPRHLDKLILNSRVVTGGTASSVVGAATGGSNGRGAGKAGGSAGKPGSALGRGNSEGRRSKLKEREAKEKGERKKERRGGSGGTTSGLPPAPPPTEDGMGDIEVVVTAPTSSSPTSPSVSSTTPTTPASTAPVSSTSTTPPSPAHPSPEASPKPQYASTTPSSTNANTNTAPGTALAPAPAPALPPRPLSHPLALGLSNNTPALTDDASVLPVPSHVVLHHLSTSAIKNGVLAVGNTTRYRKKYLTTIYYKPT